MREWGWAEELSELCVEGGEDVEEREKGLCIVEWEGLWCRAFFFSVFKWERV